MNFKAELTAMKGRLFSPELYQAMGEASTQRRRERGLTWKDAIWRRAQAQLDPQLTPRPEGPPGPAPPPVPGDRGSTPPSWPSKTACTPGSSSTSSGTPQTPPTKTSSTAPCQIHQPQTEDPLPRPPGGRPGSGRCPDPVPARGPAPALTQSLRRLGGPAVELPPLWLLPGLPVRPGHSRHRQRGRGQPPPGEENPAHGV